MKNSLSALFLFFYLIACNKGSDSPAPTTPILEEIIPGVNVGLGAELVDESIYQKLPLLPDPLAGARLAKDPTLPERYELNTPPVGNQGSQGSCTAWAVAYAARSYFNITAKKLKYANTDGTLNEETVFSPAFLYNLIHKGNCKGTRVSEALDLLKQGGVCSLKDMSYKASDCSIQPSEIQKQKASEYKIKNWGRINITTNVFRKYLYFDYPIIITSILDDNFKKQKEKDANSEYLWKTYDAASASGAHAMVIVGYDDTKKAFKIQNSWSERWGNKGYIWLNYDIVDKAIREAYVMTTGDNSSLKSPKVQTGSAVKAANGQATMTGSIIELGDEPVINYGICASIVRELPTEQYSVENKTITALPYSFTVTPSITNSRIYYRAFAQTPTTIVYGDTSSIVIPQTSDPTNGVGKNLLLFHDGNRAYALNADDGTLAWKSKALSLNVNYDLGGVITGNSFCIGDGPFKAFNLSDGLEKWSYSPSQLLSETSFPVAASGTIFYHSKDYLYATDALTGTLKWRLEASATGSGNTFQQYGLSLANNLIYVNMFGNSTFKLFSIDPITGRQPKQIPIDSPYGNPLIVNDFMSVSHGSSSSYGDGGLRGYTLSSNKLVWTSTTSNGQYPASVNNIIYSVSYARSDQKNYLVAVDQATGVQKWKYIPSQGNIENGSMSVFGNSVTIKVLNNVDKKHRIHVIDAGTGKLRWESAGLAYNNFTLAVGSKVYSSADGEITAFDINTGNILWKTTGIKQVSTSPMCMITADGKTYYVPQSGMQQ